MQARCLTLTSPSLVILRRLSQYCGKLKGAAERGWRDTNYAAEDLREVARAGVAHFEADVDEAARGLPDQLLGMRDALAGHEVQRSHSGGLLEDVGKV